MFSLKHLFHSPKADGTDSTLVRPSAWNDEHSMTASQSGIVVGRVTAGPGPMEEVPISQMFPIGAVTAFAGAAAPAGWLLCYGQSLIQADYPNLYAAIGLTYGAGPGPSTFLLPDLRGVAVGGKSNMGGADRGNLPGGAVLGGYLGAASTSTSVSASGYNGMTGSASVNGSTSGPSAPNIGSANGPQGTSTDGHVHNISFDAPVSVAGTVYVSGSTGTINIIQPTVCLNYIIKY